MPRPAPHDQAERTGENRVPAHARWSAYENDEQAVLGDRAAGGNFLTLNGDWRFHLAGNPDDAPPGWERADFDDRAWETLAVPGNWQMQSRRFDDRPIYTNVAYPFPPDPPRAPARNPTGCYRRAFLRPERWTGKVVRLVFDSADSMVVLWVNGRYVGFSTDSKLPAEFDVTDFLAPGENHVAAKVLRYCAGSYLEDQDYWQVSGLQRDVYLVAKNPVHLRDWAVRTDFDDPADLDPDRRAATLRVRAYVGDQTPAPAVERGLFFADRNLAGHTVTAELLDPGGRLAAPIPPAAPVGERSPMYGDTTPVAGCAQLALRVPAARPWTAETPRLYTLILTLRDAKGRALDIESQRVGFRTVAVGGDGVLRLNGRRLIVRGVNRHEWNARRGRAVTEADMRRDIELMKRLNFNAVRTSHYPNAPRWYELCDEYGLYVVDEANCETHGVEALISKDPAWTVPMFERVSRLAPRDRNHACVIAWSLGNECSRGPAHAAMAGWLRAYDPTRPVQYESGGPGPDVSDILTPMYPSLSWARRTLADPAERRPMVLCEYAYAKGNSTGNFFKFWDMVEELPRFQGGFLWDWSDKAVYRRTPEGVEHLDYGEVENEEKGTERMCLNGIVGPDLEITPGAREVHVVQSPVQFRSRGPAEDARGRFRLLNRHLALPLGRFDLLWEVFADGRIAMSGRLPCPDAGPDADADVDLALAPPARAPVNAAYFVNLRVVLREGTPWAPAGHVVGAAQFALPWGPTADDVDEEATPTPAWPVGADAGRRPPRHLRAPALDAAESPERFRFDGPRLAGEFDRARGVWTRLAFGGADAVADGPEFGFHRAPTDIDRLTGTRGIAYEWRAAGLDRLERATESADLARRGDGAWLLDVRTVLTADGTGTRIRCLARYVLRPEGRVSASFAVDARPDPAAGVESLARVGVRFILPERLTRVAWLGRGPHENYPDRRRSAFVGRYAAAVADMYVDRIFPQEGGLRTDTRRVDLTDAYGRGLRVTAADAPFAFSALPYRWEDLERAPNRVALVPRAETVLTIDAAHMGLGGDTGWSRHLYPEFRVPAGAYRFAFDLEGVP